MAQYNQRLASENMPWTLDAILPKVLVAGEAAGTLTEEGAKWAPARAGRAAVPRGCPRSSRHRESTGRRGRMPLLHLVQQPLPPRLHVARVVHIGVDARQQGPGRITSYNVCYTKLLRDGAVTSRTLEFASGERKTLGIMQPGEYRFTTGKPELMEILSGSVSVRLDGEASWRA